MNQASLLVAAVFAVGVLHTIVPDHWVPIALISRQHRWSPLETARVAAGAGLGHTVSTLVIGLLIWVVGVVAAQRFATYVSIASSVALIAFGGWIALTALRDILHHEHEHHHPEIPVGGSGSRTALILILGSSPMIEGIPAFLAASRFGVGLIAVMSAVFAISTIATYVALCVYSAKGLQRLELGRFERYGEVLSGTVVALVGAVFLVGPV